MDNEIVFPNYNHCILNTITSILKYYNVETKHASLTSLDKILEKHYKKKHHSIQRGTFFILGLLTKSKPFLPLTANELLLYQYLPPF